MKLKTLACSLLLLTAACQKSQDSADNVLDTVGNETSASYNSIRDLADLPAKKTKVVEKVQPRYCYQALQDIMCYGQPIAGEEYRLVGYQDSSGHAGYTLPSNGKVEEKSSSPPLPALKSVTVPPPPAVAGSKGQLKEVIFDPAELEPKQLVPPKQE